MRLGDVAQVKDGAEDQRTLALYNGKEAVGIDLKKAKGYSTTDVSERVISRIEEVRKRLPANVKLDVVRDAGARVDASVGNVEEALLLGAMLTVLVVFLFLNSWRSTVITGLALPVSVLASFMAVAAFGFTLNMMSLLGLSLAIGILIDDAIVVREEHRAPRGDGQRSLPPRHDGTDEIGLAVAATTFSILAVFIPVAFLTGNRPVVQAVRAHHRLSSVLVSLMVSFSLDPMLSALARSARGAGAAVFDHADIGPVQCLVQPARDRVQEVIAWALDHRWIGRCDFAGDVHLPRCHDAGAPAGQRRVRPRDRQFRSDRGDRDPPGSNLEYMKPPGR